VRQDIGSRDVSAVRSCQNATMDQQMAQLPQFC
jgi:hypothetical protein